MIYVQVFKNRGSRPKEIIRDSNIFSFDSSVSLEHTEELNHSFFMNGKNLAASENNA